MSEHTLYSEEYRTEVEGENSSLRQYSVELERELMRMRRTEKVLHEMEQRYLIFMESTVFLYVLLAPNGTFRVMNRRAEEFFGFQVKLGGGVTLQSLSTPGDEGEVESMLKEAIAKNAHAVLPIIRADATWGWLDMELFASVYQGEPSIQIIAFDITNLMKGKAEEVSASYPEAEDSPAYAIRILNSCPGLLCFAVDKKGTLLYSTRGYREIAKRFLGHECVMGFPYPVSLETVFDMELQELIQDAFLGNTATTVLVERSAQNNNRWNVTVAPLVTPSNEVAGAVVYLASMMRHEEQEAPPFLVNPEKSGAKEISRPTDRFEPAQIELLNIIPRMFCVVDDKGFCIEANTNFLKTLKLKRDDVVGHLLASLALESDPVNEKLKERLHHALQGKSFEELECRVCTKDGEVLSLGLSGIRMSWEADVMTLVSCMDNTRLRRTEEQLQRVSTTDISTGVLNRQGMERVISMEIERTVRYHGSLSLIVLDIDGFRYANEQIGYAAADRILQEVVIAIKTRIRNVDYLGRWGGDEFALLTSLPLFAATQLAKKLRDMVEHNVFGENRSLTFSAGVAEYRKSMDITAFVAAAYDAMVEAKREGGNRTVQAREDPDNSQNKQSKQIIERA